MEKDASMAFKVLPTDKWRAATNGIVGEMVAADVVVFTALVDATAPAEFRERCKARGDAKPSWTSLVIKAISLGLRSHPAMNRLVLRGWFRHRPVQLDQVHAVVAVERVRGGEDTVYATILRNTDEKSVWEISDELHQSSLLEEDDDPRLKLFMKLVRILPGPLSRWIIGLPRWSPRLWLENRGGSFALTTVGKYGVESVFVKWPWPISFTFGEVKKRPIVVDEAVKPRLSFYFSMAWNRELTNGAPAARLFSDILQHLVNAEFGGDEQQPSDKRPAK